MKVRIEVIVERREEEGKLDAMFNSLQEVARLAACGNASPLYQGFPQISKVRAPDSPEPDQTGYVNLRPHGGCRSPDCPPE